MTTKSISDLIAATGVGFGTSGVRGLVEEITDEIAYAYTQAFIKTITNESLNLIALGIDLRPSSPEIARACIAAIEDMGLKVIYCGALPTPALAFFARTNAIPAIMVTGSHIPFDRNGIKFYKVEGEILKPDEVAISSSSVELATERFKNGLLIDKPELGATDNSASDQFIDRYVDLFPSGYLSNKKVGVYQHSSVARDLLVQILEKLGCEVVCLERTDSFVPIDTEAVNQEDIEKARLWSEKHHFDAIVSTDGDGDRPLISDENGSWLRGDIVGLLTAKFVSADTVVTPVSCNTAIELSGYFKSVSRTRIGSPFVIEEMEKLKEAGQSTIVGFEANGGFLVESTLEVFEKTLDPLPTRDAVLPIVAILALAENSKTKISSLSADLPQRYTESNRLKDFPQQKSHNLLNKLKNSSVLAESLWGELAGKLKNIDETDGMRFIFESGIIVHLRPSGNAPELRCYAEASSIAVASEMVNYTLDKLSKMEIENP